MLQQILYKRSVMSDQLMAPIGYCYVEANRKAISNTNDDQKRRTEYIRKDV